ncbi:ATP-binding protein [Alicycliphilus denitrificans]|uniref:sensor histidine kinase n=1 Tax=Alicycliphilus denitrificans TaxID=179636 RepID=UPI00384C2C49
MKLPFLPSAARPYSAQRYGVIAAVLGAFLLLTAWISSTVLLGRQWQETLQAEMRQNTNTALALKEHTLRILDAADQAMFKLQDSLREDGFSGLAMMRIANETGMVPHILTQLSFVDADGRFVGSNLDPDGSRSRNVDLMEREHIRVHLRPDGGQVPVSAGLMHNGLFISRALQGKVSGTWTIQLSRRITDRDGRTLGVAVASLNQSHFEQVYQGVQLGSQGGVILSGLGGTIRARVIGGASVPTDRLLPGQLHHAIQQQTTGALVAPSSDGVLRIHGFSRVGPYPLAILCATSQEEAFSAWRDTRNAVLVLTALVSVLLLGFVASVCRLARSHQALTRSEAQAQRANQAKSEFLAAMSHELRTPLTSIRGFAELMELRSSDALVREQAGHIRQGAEHLNVLLTEILDLAKIEAGAMTVHPEPVDLSALLREVTELFRGSAMAKGLPLQLELTPPLPPTLLTDRLKLRQIIHNLMSNAIKFTSAGQVLLQAQPSDNARQVLIHVRDTGSGIPPEQLGRIFEKFSQGHERISYQHGGTGLGLSLSRALASLLGGELRVASQVGQGSTFTIALPLAQPEMGVRTFH